MKRYVAFIGTHRRPLFALFALLNILALIGLFQVKIETEFSVFTPDKSEHMSVMKEMEEIFPSSEQITLLVNTEKSELSVHLLKQLRSIQKYLESVPHVNTVTGPAPETMYLGNTQLSIQEADKNDVNNIKEYYQIMENLAPLTKADDTIYANFSLFPGKQFKTEDIHKIETYLKDSGLKHYITGGLYMQQKIFDYILMILFFMPPIALILILGVFRFQMGSMKSTILSILPAGIGALWTLGIIGWLGNEVSIITVLAPVFTIVIGSADGLHFVSHIQDEEKEGKSRTDSIIQTLRMVGIPMVITTVTSMAGFLSLLVMNNSGIRDLAVFASLGILIAGVVTWYTLPLILSGNIQLPYKHITTQDNKKTEIKPTKGKGLRKLWGIPSLIIFIGVITAAVLGSGRVKTEFNQLMIYRSYTQVEKNFKKIMKINNGSIPVFAFVKTKEDPLKPEYAQAIKRLSNTLQKTGAVTKTAGVYNFFSSAYAYMSGSPKPEYPPNLFTANMMHMMVQKAEGNITDNLIDRKNKAIRLLVFPKDLSNNTLDTISATVNDFSSQSNNINVQITGVQYLMRDLNESMITNQTRTLMIAFTLIFVLLFISIRKFLPALISLIPIGATTFFLYGFLGLSGISINVITATIFSITIGVGIDYAVHFTSVWQNFRNRGYTSHEAAEHSYGYTARPILANALGLALGLTALQLSPLEIHMYVSLLMWAAMLASVFLSLSVLPSILRLLPDKKDV